MDYEGQQLKITDVMLRNKLLNINGVFTKIRDGQTVFFCSSQKTVHITNMVIKQKQCTKKKFVSYNKKLFINHNRQPFGDKQNQRLIHDRNHSSVIAPTHQNIGEVNVVGRWNVQASDFGDTVS
jgi:hypothetical protein